MKPEEVFILDSSALLALFRGGEPGQKVELILQKGGRHGVELYLSAVDWGKCYSALLQQENPRQVKEFLEKVENSALSIVAVNKKISAEAALLAEEYRVPYEKAFAPSLGTITDGKVVTADPELQAVEEAVDVLWL